MNVLIAHESDTIREVVRRLIDGVGWSTKAVADGNAAVHELGVHPPAALVLDVAIGGVLAFEVVEEARKRSPQTRVILIASIYNRTGYKRRPTSLYGADDYVEQHHIPDALVGKLAKLIGPPPRPHKTPVAHAETPEGRTIRSAGEGRLDGEPATAKQTQLALQVVERAERLARLIVADIALYNGDVLDQAERTGDSSELEARLRVDLEEGRLLFDLRVPEEVRRARDFIGDALNELREQRRRVGTTSEDA